MDVINISVKYNPMIERYVEGTQCRGDVIEEVKHNFGGYAWEEISYIPDLPEMFIESFKEYLIWDGISTNRTLSNKFILENIGHLNLNNLLICSKLDIGIILAIISSSGDIQSKNRYYALILAYQSLGGEDLERVKFLKEICE